MITSRSNNTAAANIRLFGNVRVMIISALFVAMSIVLGKFLQIPIGDSIRISFENLPLIMAGIFFGPFIGGAVGLSADIIGCILKGYAINPIITLGAVSIGVMAGIAPTIFRKKRAILCTLLSVYSAHFVGSMIIKSIGLYIYYGTPMKFLLARFPLYIAIGAFETLIIFTLLKNKAFSAQLDKVCSNGRR